MGAGVAGETDEYGCISGRNTEDGTSKCHPATLLDVLKYIYLSVMAVSCRLHFY